MNLPQLSRQELNKASKRDELIKETAQQIIKDFAEFSMEVEFSGNAGSFYKELFLQLENHISHLLENSNAKFMGLLYRIDISAKDINRYEDEMAGEPYTKVITELIIHRELKKILIREYFRKNR